ncbi:unnamed protein product, partial [Didymodactylos carnosus]
PARQQDFMLKAKQLVDNALLRLDGICYIQN